MIAVKRRAPITVAALVLLSSATAALAGISVVAEHNDTEHASADFKFKHVAAPCRKFSRTRM